MFLELMERVAGQLAGNLPFVVYRKPKEKVVHALLQQDKKLHEVSDFTESGFVLAPFNSDRPAVLLKVDVQLEAGHSADGHTEREAGTVPRVNPHERDFHINLVKKGIAKIQKGEIKKMVLSRCLRIDCPADPLDLFQSLLSTYANAFCYLWYHPGVGMWLGATPEILLRCGNRQLTTMSLAGTQPYRQNTDPVWGQKEIGEQALVTEFIHKALESKVSGLTTSDLESVRAGDLWHLRTKLSGRVHGSLSEIIEALHPTPAVCGLPLREAKQFIHEHENYDREYYTGYLGELNMKRERYRTPDKSNSENRAYRTVTSTTELFVNLRCMQLQGNKGLIYIGGGVTVDSDPLKEWEETVNKSFTMLKAIQGT